ncbi:hypothetical protein [Sphingomonas sp. AX6]|uniref:hypothetical protein n=1 Tax=Sphingomonas sp. AX6 TaxID=2653171 RepID=UPI0012F43694|nr:hypothetical protein [Sphingomonas sp. AX6]VXC93835.1 membrane hypothetical protein [Sphingomonas sp. AX6]
MADRGDHHQLPVARTGWRPEWVTIAIVGFSVAAIASALSLIDASPRMLFADPAATVDQPVYLGLFSALSVMAWTAAASIAAFGVAIVRGRARLLCAVLAAFTFWLALDDQFMLHESVGPSTGIPQKAFFVCYALFALGLAAAFRHVLSRGPWPIAATALVMLGLSVGIDVASDRSIYFAADWMIVIEDGAKLIGALLWGAYMAGLVRAIGATRIVV